MNKELRKILNTGNLTLEETEINYIIHVDNRCGEDFTLEVEKSSTSQEICDLMNECENYDIDEHFSLWYGANRGEPHSARALLENCEEIGEELDRLYWELNKLKK